MAVKLRTSLEHLLVRWPQDLPAPWRQVIGHTKLDWNAGILDREIQPGEIILPSRKGKCLPGAPDGAHIFRD